MVGKIFETSFWSMSLLLTKAAFIDQKYSKTSKIVKYDYNLK